MHLADAFIQSDLHYIQGILYTLNQFHTLLFEQQECSC